MNTTPRLLNRLVLAVVGLLLLAAGAAGLSALTLPAVASWWGSAAPRVGGWIDRVRRGTTLEGQSDTWLWLALAAALLVLIVLLALWIAAQGRGRTGLFASVDGHAGGSSGARVARDRDTGDRDAGDSGTPGSVVITAAAVEQALKAALLERTDLAGASVSTWEVRGVPGLRVRVFPRKGVPPYVTAAEVSRLVEALDVVTGYRTPVLISIRSGARVRFTRAERVT
ncbi:hypothetical protein [Arthrobacter burdickii]|uniref:Alkaline shock response membrane anchor protein AmaP n=1 Tax=Arthrobacter burdickii TaxID=3035920 RepID=A0ABT8JX15_9MICC|nr:hypothetical protein [Arthrobacter burdickii]MDN4609397.1 hypothetical protein [Arthrobacter burdickii]